MKTLLALLLLGSPAVGWACAPVPYDPAENEARLLQYYGRVTDVVYGVVERDIRSDAKRTGRLRILHVYKGKLAVGDQVLMRYSIPPAVYCPVYLPSGYVHRQRRGTFGVTFISRTGPAGVAEFKGFLPSETVERMIRAGLIKSARADTRLLTYPPPPASDPSEGPPPWETETGQHVYGVPDLPPD